MASAGTAPASAVGKPSGEAMIVDKLPEEINEMKIRDEKVEKVGLSYIYRLRFVHILSVLLFSM